MSENNTNKRGHDANNPQANKKPKKTLDRKCVTCSSVKSRGDYSKNQWERGVEGSCCKDCMNIQNTAKAAPKLRFCCRVCKENATYHSYTNDQRQAFGMRENSEPTSDTDQEEGPICVGCILKMPRVCKKCKETKPVDQFSKTQLMNLPSRFSSVNIHRNLTVARYKSMDPTSLCLACEKIEIEEHQKAEAAKTAQVRAYLRKHNVVFYGLHHSLEANCGATGKPESLVGTYDIIYHHGYDITPFIENRTTKGTCKFWLKTQEEIAEDDKKDNEKTATDDSSNDGDDEKSSARDILSGSMEFAKEIQISEHGCYQKNFTLSSSDGTDFKTCLVNDKHQRFIDSEWEGRPVISVLTQLKRRVACPWRKYEISEHNTQEDEMVKFETLEEAEALIEKYKRGNPKHWLVNRTPLVPEVVQEVTQFLKPKPVLFLEPGDLVLSTDWVFDSMRGQCDTISILRRRKEN
ncbi:expressed unknown protein [Seminavis robusta]|uniref:Stc1 domain-containing protein n=1 Tax=Seminavis robusta TaxID=568900 RepID=A0A9N8E1B3_9STRA|nr:expressed unknown protein [Seminavis robusta]|eukprot:Sro549_g164520.1 n/a (463) ;mRNA; r:8895-10283